MKKLTLLCLSLVFLAACSQATKQEKTQPVDTATSQTIDWSQAGPDAREHQISFADVEKAVAGGAVFYDVRSKAEYETSNFGITTNFPITDMEQGNLPAVDKDTPIYIHCLKGIRSAQATAILREAGFSQVYDLGGVEHVQAIGGQLIVE